MGGCGVGVGVEDGTDVDVAVRLGEGVRVGSLITGETILQEDTNHARQVSRKASIMERLWNIKDVSS